ncbi:hypothetical protein [Legionella spiritensis]|uniref:Integral membrane protein (PIN domain superfamily) n=1 Tax=Legionella spiritensis TaxID=452 RepID=A0A0W0Z5E4_LEGSP|nr:hypothetical protein [Legionella spiritensis]KTD64333.1 Integral membrane protein (PIN domain superfamily) [Legionella spiritensis]SNV46533.1 Integral membrane protein (PIN domain superfamily) [Legionella spiritensis]
MSTLFLATVIGWYLVIVSLFLLFRRETMRTIMAEILAQRALVFVLAVFTLILGLLMVTSHNIWVMAWPVVVTLISWLVLISGLLRFFCPDTAIKMGRSFLNHPTGMNVTTVIFLIIGLFLLFQVYFAGYLSW